MKLRTLEKLSDSLTEDFVWRRKELFILKSLIQASKKSSSQQKALIRSGIPILYAHWEGFVKAAASNYLEYVALQGLRYTELQSNFVALAVKNKLSEARESNKASIFIEAITSIRSDLEGKSNIPYKGVIQTGSNLNSSFLKEITVTLGLDYSEYEIKENLIDEKLLAKRNNIAHGEYLQMEESDYIELHDEVVLMMNLFRNQVENCASQKKYLRTTSD